MLSRPVIVTVLAAGMCVTAVVMPATPALAKGPLQAVITGPGLPKGIVITGNGEPGQVSRLERLAVQTSLFALLFGASGNIATPVRLHPPPRTSLGPRYTLVYTVPGVTPQHGEQYGRIRQELYPRAAGGPVIYTPPGQAGFGRPLQDTGWIRASAHLIGTLTRLGLFSRHDAARPPGGRPSAARAAAHHSGADAPGWLIGSAVGIVAVALAGAAWMLRRRRLAFGAARGRARGTA